MRPTASSPLRPVGLALTIPLLMGSALVPQAQPPEPQLWEVPETDVGVETLEARRAAQLRESPAKLDVFHQFRFEDRQPQSGITFTHRVVGDGAKFYKLVHYDHGNGVVAADVDGDRSVDLYFLNQEGPNELWRNLGDGRFEDITARAGVALRYRVSVAASFADLDNDGDPDLYVTSVKMGNVLFENLGGGRFRDRTSHSGLGHVGHSSAPVFFDYDNDGRLDLLLTNVGVYTTDRRGIGGYFIGLRDAFQGHLHDERSEPNLLYRGLGELRFEEVSQRLGFVDRSWSGDATFVDFNRDRYPDLYVLNMQGDDRYWENAAGERFVDRSTAIFPRTPWGSMGVKSFDYDNDGRFDLLLTDMHSDMSEEVGPEREHLKSRMQWEEKLLQGGENNIFGNAFFRNLGPGEEGPRFEEVSDRVGLENYWPWGVSVGDLNADGWEDVLITSSMNFPYRYGLNSLKLNNRGLELVDAELLLGIEPRRGGRTKTPWFDLDCDAADREHRLCAERSGRYRVMANLGSRSAVFFDLDLDGDLDIVTAELNSEPQVLVSNLAEQRPVRFVGLRLVGTRSNRDGLGATVRVLTGERTLTRYHDGKSGYMSQSSLPLYLGLDRAEVIDRIEVEWPSGIDQTLPGPIETNARLEIREAGPPPE